MNCNFLIKKRVKFPIENIEFLNFIFPHFDIIGKQLDKLSGFINRSSSLEDYHNHNCDGIIIFTDSIESDFMDQLNVLTDKWIIISDVKCDIDLSTNESMLKHFMPFHYLKLNKMSKDGEVNVYNTVTYSELLEKIKVCLIENKSIAFSTRNDCDNMSQLFASILQQSDRFNSIYFSTVNSNNVAYVTSSVLTFLGKVQSNSTKGESAGYSQLITLSHSRYGKHIKNAVKNFVVSKANAEISLYNLLSYLNKAH